LSPFTYLWAHVRRAPNSKKQKIIIFSIPNRQYIMCSIFSVFTIFALAINASFCLGLGSEDVVVQQVNSSVLPITLREAEKRVLADEPFNAFSLVAKETFYCETPYSVLGIDMNMDGINDIVAGCYGHDTIEWYENYDTHGLDSFTTHIVYDGADGVKSIFGGDLNGDGHIDLASASELDNTIRWHENDGTGSFTTHTIYTSHMPMSITGIDLNGDGHIDLASADYGSNAIRYYLNDGTGSFSWTDTVYVGANGAHGVTGIDMNNGGYNDLASVGHDDDDNALVWWHKNTQAQTFTNVGYVTFDTKDVFNLGNGYYPRSVVGNDLNGTPVCSCPVSPSYYDR